MLITLIEILIAMAFVFGAFMVTGAIAACMLSSQISREEEQRTGRLQE